MSSFDPWKRRRPHQKTLFCRQSVGGNLVLQPAEILNDNLEVIFEIWMEPGEHSSGTPPVQPSFTLLSDGLIDIAWRRRRKWKGSIRNSRRVGRHVMVMNKDEKRLWVSSVCNWRGLQYAKQTNVWNAGTVAREVCFRKSKSKFKFARPFKPDALFFLPWVHEFPPYFLCFIRLRLLQQYCSLFLDAFPKLSPQTMTLVCLNYVVSTLNTLFPSYQYPSAPRDSSKACSYLYSLLWVPHHRNECKNDSETDMPCISST